MIASLRWFLDSPDGLFLFGVGCFAFLLGVWWLVGYGVDALSVRWEAKQARTRYAAAAGRRTDRRRLDAVVEIGSWRKRA